MQQDTNRKERISGIAGLYGMEDCHAGRRKQKAQLKRRWQHEVRQELVVLHGPGELDDALQAALDVPRSLDQ